MSPTTPTNEAARRGATVRKPEQLPSYRTVLTAVTGKVRVREDDRAWVAVLELGPAEAAVVWTGARERREDLAVIIGTTEREGYRVSSQLIAPADLLRVIYDTPAHTAGSALGHTNYQSRTADSFDDIIGDALARGASDVHLQVKERAGFIKFRIHGELRDYAAISHNEARALSEAVYNVFTDNGSARGVFRPDDYLDASVTRHLRVGDRDVALKLRFSSKPAYPSGWKIVLRLLPLGDVKSRATLHQLGYDDAQVRALTRMLARPRGLILLCGETGSGKSTTLMTMGHEYYRHNEETVNVVSIEDPPEYDMSDFCTQVPVVRGQTNEQGESGFARALRQVLRSDPDAVIVGECRDRETANLLLLSVQTGHKTFSTLHTGTAFGVFARLARIGLSYEDMADDDVVAGIIAQQLVPVLCPHCSVGIDAVKRQLGPEVVRRINMRVSTEQLSQLRFRSDGKIDGATCPQCDGLAIVGRTVVAEILVPDAEIRRFIEEHDITLARAYWRANIGKADARVTGRTMLDQAVEKMLAGKVSPVDVEAICGPLDDGETVEAARERYEELMRTRRAKRDRDEALARLGRDR